VAELVHDGDLVALEGFTHLIPFAAGHEIIRQRRRRLTLARIPDVDFLTSVPGGGRTAVITDLGVRRRTPGIVSSC